MSDRSNSSMQNDFANSKLTICTECRHRKKQLSDYARCGAITHKETIDPINGEAAFIDRNGKLTFDVHPTCRSVNTTAHCDMFAQRPKLTIGQVLKAWWQLDYDLMLG